MRPLDSSGRVSMDDLSRRLLLRRRPDEFPGWRERVRTRLLTFLQRNVFHQLAGTRWNASGTRLDAFAP